jgi:soluble lytic murein transglycosylase-like protein
MIQVESAGDTLALSEAGAKGLLQLMPIAVEDVAAYSVNPECKRLASNLQAWQLFHGPTNVRLGVCYIQLLTRSYGLDLTSPNGQARLLMLYNSGHQGYTKWQRTGKMPAETKAYIINVLTQEHH